VRGRDEDRVGIQAVDDEPFGVDRLPAHVEPVAAQALRLGVERRILDRDPAGAVRGQHARDEVDPLRGALDDEDPRRVGDHPAHPSEMVGEHLPELALAARVAVVERGRGRRPHDVEQRRRPRPERKQRHVRGRRDEVVARRLRRRIARLGRPRRPSDRGDGRSRLRPRDEEPLGLELPVRLGRHAPRDAELAGERP
jgi:hypothetical protein